MAVVKTPQESRLGIKVENGTSASGTPLNKTIRFSNVKASATDQDVFDLGNAIANLQGMALVAIIRTDDAFLTAE